MLDLSARQLSTQTRRNDLINFCHKIYDIFVSFLSHTTISRHVVSILNISDRTSYLAQSRSSSQIIAFDKRAASR